MKKKREESFAKSEERLKAESKKKAEVKRENEQYALKEIMKVTTCSMQNVFMVNITCKVHLL